MDLRFSAVTRLGYGKSDGKLAGYSVRFHEFHPCAMGKPAFVKTFFETLMRRTDTGMQLSVWIERA